MQVETRGGVAQQPDVKLCHPSWVSLFVAQCTILTAASRRSESWLCSESRFVVQDVLVLLLVAVGTSPSYVSFLLCRSRTMCSGDVALLACLGAYAAVVGSGCRRGFSEGDPRLHGDVEGVHSSVGLMVEESHSCECHGDAVAVAGSDDMVVAHAASGLCHPLYPTLVGTLDVVAEGEEGV